MTTFSPTLDERFRAAAAASGLLDAAFDVVRTRRSGPARRRHRPRRLPHPLRPRSGARARVARAPFGPRVLRSSKPVDRVRRELDEYFAGKRRASISTRRPRCSRPTTSACSSSSRASSTARRRPTAARRADRQPARRAGRRHGDEPQPDPDRPPVPPRRRRERQPYRLCRRARAQGAAAPARGRDPVALEPMSSARRVGLYSRPDRKDRLR